MGNQTAREMTPAECIAKARNNIKEAEIKIATAERLVILAEKRAEAEQVKYPPVTGRPFTKENPPKRNGMVYSRDDMSESGCYGFSYCSDDPDHVGALKHGELYPTEADCRYGEKKRKIEARYRGMGRAYKKSEPNICAWYSTFHQEIKMGHTEYMHAGQIYFDTKEACQAAIGTIDREYGEGTFEKYVLEVRV